MLSLQIMAHTTPNTNGAPIPSPASPIHPSSSAPTPTPTPTPAPVPTPAPTPAPPTINMNDFDEEEEEFESGVSGVVSTLVSTTIPSSSVASPTSTQAPPQSGGDLDESFEEETMEESGSVFPSSMCSFQYEVLKTATTNNNQIVASPPHASSPPRVSSPTAVPTIPSPTSPLVSPPSQSPLPIPSNGSANNALVRSRFKEEIRARIKPYALDLIRYPYSINNYYLLALLYVDIGRNHFAHPTDNPRNLIKVLIATIPYRESRQMASQMMEG